ncbi:ABC transporter substrate-binding protein [Tolumonas lignilytica]|uniref:ABC transporter substrate-binding protein n=1 Tax=Tolumonas lignilytica TaxID=1283284 RepID=UPI00046789AF|nr:ABC transporter substrate-binding protein [Tolumonas lignilytica]
MKKIRSYFYSVALILGFILTPVQAKQVVDMAGREISLPQHIGRIYTFSHSFSIITALAPEKLVGFPFPFKMKPEYRAYLPVPARDLPQISVGQDMNLEQVKAAGIDLAVGWNTPAFQREQLKQLQRVSVPAVLVGVDKLSDYPATFRFLGKVLDKSERAEKLARYIETASMRLAKAVSTIPEKDKIRVYYAESVDGLTSQCGEADRAEVIRLAGAVNALICQDLPPAKAIPADIESSNVVAGMETLVRINPDVIITRFPATTDMISNDPRWAMLNAVKLHRVYAIPSLPFNWFDRPPSFMRIMGAQWLANKLYPSVYPVNLEKETHDFYQLFFQVDLDKTAISKLLNKSN